MNCRCEIMPVKVHPDNVEKAVKVLQKMMMPRKQAQALKRQIKEINDTFVRLGGENSSLMQAAKGAIGATKAFGISSAELAGQMIPDSTGKGLS